MLSAVTLAPSMSPPTTTPTKNQVPALRSGRPDWSFEWRSAKTGGVAIHRRHCVRSGLMKAALTKTLEHAVELNQLDAFYGAAARLLKVDPVQIGSDHEAELLLEALFARLHNNHMNIFYGAGSYNQMLGTLAHGLEKCQAHYFHELSRTTSIEDVQVVVQNWLLDSVTYALCEYMNLTAEQQGCVHDCVVAHLCLGCAVDTQELYQDLSQLQLFADRPLEGPMEIQVHQERQRALMAAVQVVCDRLHFLLKSAQMGAKEVELPLLIHELRELALSLLDSANLDISEASHDDIRRLQNTQGVRTTIALTSLIQKPDLAIFEAIFRDFLEAELQGGEILGLGHHYQDWFEKETARKVLFESITAPEPQILPSLESARFNPRSWDARTKKAFRAGPDQQRLHLIPSTLVRQLGYAVSNYMVAHDQLPELQRLYERLFKLEVGEIGDLSRLQEYHSQLVHRVHNDFDNIVIGPRARQIARENMLFALESNALILVRGETGSWLKGVAQSALSGYLSLTPTETRVLQQAVEQFVGIGVECRTELHQALSSFELMSDQWISSGPLQRYSCSQRFVFQEKTALLIDHISRWCSQAKNDMSPSALGSIQEELVPFVFDRPVSLSERQRQRCQILTPMHELRQSCLDSSKGALSPSAIAGRYEHLLQKLL